MSLNAGSTFLLPRKLEWKDHLFIVLLGPNPEGDTVIVNFTSAKPHSDRTTVLQVGEHPFVTRETIVNYLDATITKAERLEQAIMLGLAKEQIPLSPQLLTRIHCDILRSPFTKIKVKNFIKKSLGLR